ncbi:MAG: hypothetical protein ACRCUS_10535, partial [Anaerovoracaceae bacterium]
MKFANNFSKTLFLQTIRRFFYIPLLGVIYYNVFSILPIVTAYDKTMKVYAIKNALYFGQSSEYVNNIIFGIPQYLVLMTVPLILGIIIFRYINSSTEGTFIQSLPYNRNTVFWSNFSAGMTMIVGMTAVISLELFAAIPGKYFSVLLLYVVTTIIVNLVIFAVVALACSVTGNIVAAVFASATLMFLPAVIAYSLKLVASYTIYGFGYSFENARAMYLCPLTAFIDTSIKNISFLHLLYFLALILLTVLAWHFHKRVKVENCGTSLTTKWIKHIIGFAFTGAGVFAAIVFTIMITEDYEEKAKMVSFNYAYDTKFTLLLIGLSLLFAAIAYYILQVLLKRKFKALEKKSLINFAIYFGIIVLLVGSIKMDIMGYTEKVPTLAEVESVEISMPILSENGYGRFGYVNYKNNSNYKNYEALLKELSKDGRYYGSVYYTQREKDIAQIEKIHKKIISVRKEKFRSDEMTYGIQIKYNLKEGGTLERNFGYLPKIVETPGYTYDEIYDSKDFKGHYALSNLDKKSLNYMSSQYSNGNKENDNMNLQI